MEIFGEGTKIIQLVILGAALICGLYQDVRYLKISNKLNVMIAIMGLILALFSGRTMLLSSLAGIAVPFVIGFVLFALRLFGAGDVKFFMALGALMGYEWILKCMIYSVFFGAAMAIVLMIVRGIFLERMRYMWNYLKSIFLTRKIREYQVMEDKKKQFFPFAIAICCGSLLTFVI